MRSLPQFTVINHLQMGPDRAPLFRIHELRSHGLMLIFLIVACRVFFPTPFFLALI